jgi:hypothetical protein
MTSDDDPFHDCELDIEEAEAGLDELDAADNA